MAKKYTRKHVSSLKELDLEQDRIRYKVRRIEDDWMDIFQPQQLAINLVTGLLNRRKKKMATQPVAYASSVSRNAKNKKVKKSTGIPSLAGGLLEKQTTRKIFKKIGISFLQWQAFNLALYLGKKALKSFKEKKQHQKAMA